MLVAVVVAGCGGGGGSGDGGETGAKAPVASSGSFPVTEDLSASTTLNANDPNNDPLTFSIVSNGSKGTATITDAVAGAVSYVPNANETGTDSFTFKANDGSADSNIATITVTIAPINDAPVAQAGILTTNEDAAKNGVVVATDVELQTLLYSIVTDPGKGTLTVFNQDTGDFTYVPNPDASGSDSFTFKASDGLLDSNVAVVTVSINDVNDAPVAQAGSLTTDEDAAKNGMLVAADVDSPTLTYSIVTNGSKGTATITNPVTGAYTFTPDPDASGSDSFTFKASDSLADSNVESVTVSINAVNDAPVAQTGSLSTDEDTAKNGMLAAADVDGPTLTYSIVTNGSKGTAAITNSATGAYTYTPNPDANGSDNITFKANDGEYDSNQATVTIDISPVNDPPVAYSGCDTTPQAVTLSGFLSATDPDVSDLLTYSLNANGSGGTGPITTDNGATVNIIDSATGEYTYQPATGAGGKRGLDSFDYQVSDSTATSNATETVIVDQKIMPLGDSITMGEEWLGPPINDWLTNRTTDGFVIGYREALYNNLNIAGYTYDFVGSLLHGSGIFNDFQHEGHPAWTAGEIANGRLGGYPTDGVRAWLDLNPADIILLHAGTNQLHSTDQNDIASILNEIDAWEGSPNGNPVTVLLALIIDQYDYDTGLLDPYVTTFNTAVNNMAQSRIAGGDDIIIVNQHDALNYPADMSEDTGVALHPNDTGYTKMANAWFTTLETVLDKCP